MTEIQNEIKRKLTVSLQTITEAQKLIDEITETDPAVVEHLIDLIDKQSQLLNILMTQAKVGMKSESPEIDDGVTNVLDDYYRLKKEEIKAKLAHLDGKMAAKLRKQLDFEN